MNYEFSERVKPLAPSAIREMMKYSSLPGFVSLAIGSPAPDAFPVKEIAEISDRILREQPIDALQYSVTEGYVPLRNYLKEYMHKKHNTGTDDDSLMITSGAQQVMELATKVMCNEGDTVICESPSFIGSLNAFRSYKVNLAGVPMESDGMDIDALENTLKTAHNPKLIYIIANFQNPTGITTSLEKRKAIYDLAKKYNVMIVEDNPYGDIRFKGENIPNIKSLDDDGRVIYAGTFSKVLAPGMRVGYCIAPSEVVQKMVVCKQVSDVHTQIWSQMIAYEFMTKYDYEAHLEKIRAIYRKKAKYAMGLIDAELGSFVKYNPIEGGLFLWLDLPDRVDSTDFFKAALEQKVAVVQGSTFAVGNNSINSIRINYSAPADDNLTTAIKVLGKVAKQF